MKHSKFGLKVSVFFMVATFIVGATAITASAKTFKVQTNYNAGDFALKCVQDWAEKLKVMTNGSLTLELMPNRAVVPHKETPEAVTVGVLDGDWTAISYFAGRDRSFALMGDLTAGYDSADQVQAFCAEGGGKEVLQQMWDKTLPGIHVVGCGAYSREALVAKVPIKGLADLKGIKIRAPEGLASEVFKRAGAAPVGIPGSEIYTALEKGVVDAADSSAYVNNDARGLHKIAKFPLYPGIHSTPSVQFTLSQRVWDKLTDAEKATIETWFLAAINDLRRMTDLKDKEVIARDRAKGELTIIDWPQADRDALREIAVGAWEDFAESSALAKAAYDANVKFMKESDLLK